MCMFRAIHDMRAVYDDGYGKDSCQTLTTALGKLANSVISWSRWLGEEIITGRIKGVHGNHSLWDVIRCYVVEWKDLQPVG